MTSPTVEPNRPPETGAAAQPRPAARGTDQIGAWLDRLVRVTRLRPPEADELRDELDAHLRERVRDLMLTGHDEADAIHKSISELGDLALLAQRYRDAVHTPQRRLLMHAALIGIVGSTVGLGAFALQQGAPPPAQNQSPDAPPALASDFADRSVPNQAHLGAPGRADTVQGNRSREDLPILRDIPVVGTLFSNADGTEPILGSSVQDAELRDVLVGLAEPYRTRVYTYWDDVQVPSDTEISDMPFEDQTVEKALEMLSDSLGLEGSERLDHRVANGLMEFASRGFFDQREIELASYDVSNLLELDSPLEQSHESDVLTELVMTLVEPHAWMDAGGKFSIHVAGNRLFVNAPQRLHRRVVWLLAELEDQTHARSVPGARPTDVDPVAVQNPVAHDPLAHDPAARADPQERQDTFTIYSVGFISAEELRPVMEAVLAPLGARVSMYGEPNTGLIVAGSEQAHNVAIALLEQLDRSSERSGAWDQSIKVQPGDSLSSIAATFLGDARRVDELLRANPRLRGQGLNVGDEVAVPTLENQNPQDRNPEPRSRTR